MSRTSSKIHHVGFDGSQRYPTSVYNYRKLQGQVRFMKNYLFQEAIDSARIRFIDGIYYFDKMDVGKLISSSVKSAKK
jgi:hypothetical protein